MIIKVNAPKEEKEGRIHFTIPVPLSLLQLKFIWRFLPEEQRIYQSMATELVKALKQYKRENGSWILVEVHSHDDANVLIRI